MNGMSFGPLLNPSS